MTLDLFISRDQFAVPKLILKRHERVKHGDKGSKREEKFNNISLQASPSADTKIFQPSRWAEKKKQGGKKRKRERKQACLLPMISTFLFSSCKHWKSCNKKVKFGKGKEERASYLVKKVWVEEEEE